MSWSVARGTTAEQPGLGPTALDEMRIPTDLTAEHIQDSFAAPETISFWKLPGFVGLLEQSGFSSSRHRMHWYRLLSAPVQCPE